MTCRTTPLALPGSHRSRSLRRRTTAIVGQDVCSAVIQSVAVLMSRSVDESRQRTRRIEISWRMSMVSRAALRFASSAAGIVANLSMSRPLCVHEVGVAMELV